MASLGVRGPAGPHYNHQQRQSQGAHDQERPALPGISTLLESLHQGAPPTPASTNPSAAPSPSDRALNQRKPLEGWEQIPEKRRRLDDHREDYHSYPPQSSYPRRPSGTSEYGRFSDSPRAVSSNSPPVSSSSFSMSHRPAFPGNPPLSAALPPPTLPPLQQRHPSFGSPLENQQRWHAEPSGHYHSSAPTYGYSSERTLAPYNQPWVPAHPPSYREGNNYDPPYHHNQVTFQPISAHSEGQITRKRRGNLPKEATTILKQWYSAHIESPYPTEDDKLMLCNRAQLSMNQVSNWFINARRRQPGRDSKKTSASPSSSRTTPP